MREISAHECVRRLSAAVECGDSKFAFFLGAGCSVSSGIPGAGSLVKKWLPKLKRIKTGNESGAEEWAEGYYEDYDGSNPTAIYGKVIEDLFITAAERQTEIESICAGKDPAFGYAVVAKFMSHEEYCRSCNVILTTNFDDLVADALYLYTNKKPLVIAHESLIGFVKITRTGPLVMKLHGDARLAPKNLEVETERLDEAVKKVLKTLLTETGLIFLGYGGADKSIAELLRELSPGSLPWGIYWVNKQIPEGDVGDWLEERDAIWVKHQDFDEFMLLLWGEFGLEHPEEKRFADLFGNYRSSFEKLQVKVASSPGSEDKEALEVAIDKVIKQAKDWWAVELEARKYQESDSDRADEIYRAGIGKFPDSHELMGNYALFLDSIRKDYDGAEEYYKRAVVAEPNDADYPGNYAFFLENIRKDYDGAEEYYKRAIEAEPNHANNLGNYAGFLLGTGKSAEGLDFLARALELTEEPLLILECRFYNYAHTADEKERLANLKHLKSLIVEGVRSQGWDLSLNVSRAKEDGHPEPELLETLARVIAEEEEADVLDKFPAWGTPS